MKHMRNLLSVGLLLVVATMGFEGFIFYTSGRVFKVGDCIQKQPDLEPWETNNNKVHKILEVGKRHYRVEEFIILATAGSISFADVISIDESGFYNKVECPKESK